MTTIKDLPSVSSVSDGDLLPVFQSRNRRARNVSVKELGDHVCQDANANIESLRQDLANSTDPAKGAGMVGRALRTIKSVAELITVPGRHAGECVQLTSYHDGWATYAVPRPLGGGTLVWDASSTEAADNGTVFAVTGVATGRWKRFRQGRPRLSEFGAKGDDLTDDTASTQAFANYLADTHQIGEVDAGTFRLSAKINFKGTYGWGIVGAGISATTFKQVTDNTPIFDLGGVAGPGMYGYLLTDCSFDYANSQPASNTNANPIRFSQMGYEGAMHRVRFLKGSWAIKVASGIGGPWGQNWDDLQFASGLTGGAMDWIGATNAVPNNKWGRMLVEATNMVGPIFKQVRGYNWTISTLEMLAGTNVQWFDLQAGSECDIRSMKMEVLSYTGTLAFTGSALIYAPSGVVRVGQLHLGGTTAVLTPANALNLISVGSGHYEIENLNTQLTAATSNFYLASMSGGEGKINYTKRGSYPVTNYTNVGGTASSEYLTVTPDKNDKLSPNKGDADYSVAAGDPCVISFETALTAQRSINLPSGDNCFNGLRFRILTNGAVNGVNTLLVKASTVTKATLSADKTWVELEWRRNPTAHNGWRVIGYGAIP